MTYQDVYLVRHAVTAENLKFTLIGRTDPALHSLGELQASAIGDTLAVIPFAAIYASPRLRTIQTAKAIQEKQPSNPPIITVAGLAEVDFGIADGMSSLDAYEVYRELMDISLSEDAPEDFAFPEGEKREDAVVRFDRALQSCVKAHDGTVCIVSHGGVMGFWLTRQLGQPLGVFRRHQPLHASITHVRIYDDEHIEIIERASVQHIPTALTEQIENEKKQYAID